MLRNIAAGIAGFITAGAVMMACEYTNSLLYPFPEGMDIYNAEQVRQFAASMPLQALILVTVGWVVGSFSGGFVATKIADQNSPTPALILAVILTLAGGVNAWMIQNPAWFHAGGLPIFVLFTMLGEWAARPKSSAH